MKWSIRAKLGAIVAIAAVALVALGVASSMLSERVQREVATIKEHYVPLVELGPSLSQGLSRLDHALQDAVAAGDPDALGETHALKVALIARLEAAGPAVSRKDAEALTEALDSFHAAALDVSRRMIAEETGLQLIDAIRSMQEQHEAVERLIAQTTEVDRHQMASAFGRIAAIQEQAEEVRLALSVTCLALVLLLSSWVGHGVVRSLRNVSDGLARYGAGEFDRPIPVKGSDELANVALSANEMARRLGQLASEREQAAWLDATHAALVRELRGELLPHEVAERALRFLARSLETPAAVLYLADAGGTLRATAHVAGGDAQVSQGAPGSAPAPHFAPGEGLVGEAALRDELMVVTDLPAGYLHVRSGLGEAPPQSIILVPLRRAAKLVGIMELATFQPLSDQARSLLDAVRETLAITLDVARAQEAVRSLLRETQEQAVRLANQDEELRATNEELQQQHEELRLSNEELSHQAEELDQQRQALQERNETLDEARRQLEVKTVELSTVSAYKSQFLTNMSHELRTPLNSMLLLSNLLAENEERNLTDRQVEYCRTIHSAGTELRDLINQVLDLAKVEAGKQDLRIEPVRLVDVLDRARRVFEPLARDKGLTLVVGQEPGLPETIQSDRQRVDQIVTNLLGNAVKFTSAGSIALRAHRPADMPLRGALVGGGVALSVSDSGPGIPEKDLERIFAQFEQLDGQTDRRYGGTGVGLALSRELAALLGGELHVVSAEGQGTTFTLTLPLAITGAGRAPTEPAPTAPTRTVLPAPAEAEELDDRRQLSPGEPYLLLVEDDRIFAETFAEVIHGHGLKYVLATSGREGIRRARQSRPSGIILDVRLPDTDGFALLKELRSSPETASVPVHFVSAADSPERGLAMGAAGYLVKPASRRELVQVIEALVPDLASDARRVLVVEDDASDRLSLMRLLAGEKLEARQAASAAAALELLRTERFGCLVLDLSLPDMDGLELLRKIEEMCGTTMPAVVVYTGRAMTKEETRRLEAYAETIILKEGASSDRVLNEVRLFVRRLDEGLSVRRPGPPRHVPSNVRLDGKQILLVDDDMRTVYALSAALRAKGGAVLVADTGRAALAVLKDHADVDAILMDIMMPEMDGYEAMTAIRDDERFGRVPIIALTAKAMKGDAERCIAAGASDYLPKPIDMDRLLWMLHGHLNGESANAA
ncbi:MAG: hypothetical protein AMXMBFR64_56530 [Myxococcales bacterium]